MAQKLSVMQSTITKAATLVTNFPKPIAFSATAFGKDRGGGGGGGVKIFLMMFNLNLLSL
jgi:hypothetical protein